MPDNPDDFDAFFRQNYVFLIRFLRKVGFGREEAEDAAAEAMTDAYKCWSSLTTPRAWVRTVAYRIAVYQASRRREGTRRAITDWVVSRADGIEQFDAVDERLRLLQLLDLLPARQRLFMGMAS